MNRMKRKCENFFGEVARWSFNHRWLALILVTAVLVPLLAQIPNLTMDTSNEGFFKPDDQVLIDYNEFRDQFGKDEFIVIALTGENVFNLEFLEKLKQLHNDLEQSVPYLDEVTSLVNIRNTRGEEDELIVEDFLEHWPQNEDDLALLRKRAYENTLYENFIINAEGTITTIIIKPLACNPESKELRRDEGTCQPMTNVQNREMISSITPILEKYNNSDFSIDISGLPVVIEYLNITLEKDLAIIIPMIFVMVIFFLGLLFRRISGILYPIIIFIISLLSAIGVMAALKLPMTNVTTILPSFILVISICDSVHILALFYPEYQKQKNRETAIINAMRHAGLPILMTSLTTAGGMASFAAAKIAPIADLGIVIPTAVFLALFYTVLLLPALIAIFPVKLKNQHEVKKQRLDNYFITIAKFTCEKQLLVIFLFSVVLLFAIIGMKNLRFEHNALKWFPKDSIIRVATERIDQEMRGTISFDIVIDTGKADGLYDLEFIKSLEEAAVKFSKYETGELFVGKVIALTTILKETNRALHDNDENQYKLPDNRELVAQELFLFQLSGSDDLEDLVDQQFQKTRFSMHVPYRDTSKYKNFVADVESDFKERFPYCTVTTTGVNALFVEILNNVMVTMARSYTIALILISLLMIVMLGKLRMGLLSMIPNLFPILMIMGLMGWFGIPLDFGTVLIGSITIGLIVDDTIHFLHNFGKYYDHYGDPQKATAKTLKTVGRAIFVTSLVLIGAFLCDLSSELAINKNSGILIASTILVALITDFLLVPAILSLVYKKRSNA